MAAEQEEQSLTDTNLLTQTESEPSVGELILLLEQVDLDSPLAKLNETTMSDNNGGRIEL